MTGPATTYADAVLVMVEYLQQQTPPSGASLVYPLCGQRVYAESLPKTWDAAGQACIVVKQVGNRPRVSVALEHPRMELDCYGSGDSPEAAREVARKVAVQLHRALEVMVTSGVLVSAEVDGGGTTIWTPSNVRPYVPVYCNALVRAKET